MAKTAWPSASRTRRILRISPVRRFSNCRKLSTDRFPPRFRDVAFSGSRKSSDQFVASEKISKLKRRGLRCVRTVRAVVSDAGAEVAANRSRRRLGGIGGAHGIAPLQDCALGFKSEHDHFAGTHKLRQFAEKGARGM